jgi:hypothetical protein
MLTVMLSQQKQQGVAEATNEPDTRIVGGQDVAPDKYGFFANWDGSCGATVIHDDILLTAAHVSRWFN